MLLVELNKIKMSVAAGNLFGIDTLKIHEGDKIGLIGVNGAGKSTLLQLIAGKTVPDEGKIYCHRNHYYLPQLNEKTKEEKSGGEYNRQCLRQAFAAEPLLLLLDEPDNHLDMKAIDFLINQLQHFKGAFLLVSHNQDLLERVCNKYWELEGEKITNFNGTLADLLAKKTVDKISQADAYDKYLKEKKRLQKIIQKTQKQSAKTKKAPSRMGNSEARLHKMGDQKARINLDKAASRTKSRLEQLESVERPQETKNLKLDLAKGLQLYQPVLLTGRTINKRFCEKQIFAQAEFSLVNGAKAAILGDNGCGKTTLLNMIHSRNEHFTYVHNLKIGYLGQFFSEINLDESIIDNVRKVSLHEETFNRTILARLLFRTDNVYKQGCVLSGGERTRLSLAMLLLGGYNLLLLDEPTNHLDLASVKAVEQSLADYQGTIVFTSHDRAFVDAVATEIWQIKDQKITRL